MIYAEKRKSVWCGRSVRWSDKNLSWHEILVPSWCVAATFIFIRLSLFAMLCVCDNVYFSARIHSWNDNFFHTSRCDIHKHQGRAHSSKLIAISGKFTSINSDDFMFLQYHNWHMIEFPRCYQWLSAMAAIESFLTRARTCEHLIL